MECLLGGKYFRRFLLLGQQLGSEPLSLRDSLDFDRDRVNGLGQLSELRRQVCRDLWALRFSIDGPPDGTRHGEENYHEGHHDEEGDGYVSRAWRDVEIPNIDLCGDSTSAIRSLICNSQSLPVRTNYDAAGRISVLSGSYLIPDRGPDLVA